MFANAGIPEPGFGAGKLEDLSLDDWNNILATNLTGIFLAFKHAARAMIARGEGGTLLATTSAVGFQRLHRAFPPTPPARPAATASSAGRRWSGASTASAPTRCARPTACRSTSPCRPRQKSLASPTRRWQPWDPDNRAMPLKLDRPPTLARQRLPRAVPGLRRVGLHVRPVHPGHRWRLVRADVDHLAGRSCWRRRPRRGPATRLPAAGPVADAARRSRRLHHGCRPRSGPQPRRTPGRPGRRHRGPRSVRRGGPGRLSRSNPGGPRRDRSPGRADRAQDRRPPG